MVWTGWEFLFVTSRALMYFGDGRPTEEEMDSLNTQTNRRQAKTTLILLPEKFINL